MICAWRGSIEDIIWPQHEHEGPIELPLELWAFNSDPNNKEDLVLNLDRCTMKFSKFVYSHEIPLWSLVGPAFQVFSSNITTCQFLKEFSALKMDSPVVILLQVIDCERVDHIALYASKDIDNLLDSRIDAEATDDTGLDKLKLFARPLNFALEHDILKQEDEARNQARIKLEKAAAQKADKENMIKQVVLAALRLRGINRTNPDFKLLFHTAYKSTLCSIRKLKTSDITVDIAREKVEAILNIIE